MSVTRRRGAEQRDDLTADDDDDDDDDAMELPWSMRWPGRETGYSSWTGTEAWPLPATECAARRK